MRAADARVHLRLRRRSCVRRTAVRSFGRRGDAAPRRTSWFRTAPTSGKRSIARTRNRASPLRGRGSIRNGRSWGSRATRGSRCCSTGRAATRRSPVTSAICRCGCATCSVGGPLGRLRRPVRSGRRRLATRPRRRAHRWSQDAAALVAALRRRFGQGKDASSPRGAPRLHRDAAARRRRALRARARQQAFDTPGACCRRCSATRIATAWRSRSRRGCRSSTTGWSSSCSRCRTTQRLDGRDHESDLAPRLADARPGAGARAQGQDGVRDSDRRLAARASSRARCAAGSTRPGPHPRVDGSAARSDDEVEAYLVGRRPIGLQIWRWLSLESWGAPYLAVRPARQRVRPTEVAAPRRPSVALTSRRSCRERPREEVTPGSRGLDEWICSFSRKCAGGTSGRASSSCSRAFPHRWRVFFAQPPAAGRGRSLDAATGGATSPTSPCRSSSLEPRAPLYNTARGCTAAGRALIERMPRGVRLRRQLRELGVDARAGAAGVQHLRGRTLSRPSQEAASL